jgi:hypothetical protein
MGHTFSVFSFWAMLFYVLMSLLKLYVHFVHAMCSVAYIVCIAFDN